MSAEKLDPEIKAMNVITGELSELEPDAVERVLKYVSQRFQVKLPTSGGIASGEPAPPPAAGHDDFASLYDAANPKSGVERVLVAAYWFQAIQGESDFDSQAVNNELKHLGHPSTNITRDFDFLMNQKPSLAMQIRKAGTTKQARKRYRLTVAGMKVVQRLLSGESVENDE